MSNPRLEQLHPYPFEKLATLKQGVIPPEGLEHIALSIGEPRHEAPAFVCTTLGNSLHSLSHYPKTRGSDELREAIAHWLENRYQLESVNPETQVLPVNGTREALFAFAQAVVDSSIKNGLVIMPNPCYQIYEGAALLAGSTPLYLPCLEENSFMPDFEQVTEEQWQRCQLLYICSPGNPTGAVLPMETLTRLIRLAKQHDFIIASDECYSEIYFDRKPPGLLEACQLQGNPDFSHCVVFHSLSKRSNLPGLRSGFVAGDKNILADFLRYRTYHGCAMPGHHQLASIAAWQDEEHVIANRSRYREKFEMVHAILSPVMDISLPDASFYFWAKTPIDDCDFARKLFATQNLTVLPGQFLARDIDGINPGKNRIRMALVADEKQCEVAALRIKKFIKSL